MATAPARSPITSRKQERRFYVVMAIVTAVIVLFGFSRTYFLKSFFGTPSLPPLVHLHGFVFTSWIVLLVMQTTLVSAGRTDIHRRLGVLGAILAGVMIVVGPLTAINAARLGRTPPGAPPLMFLAVPIFDIVVFATVIIAGMYLRGKPEHHKRLMLIATFAILPAAFARFPFQIVQTHMPLDAFIMADILLLGAVIYDTVRHGRLHPAFAWAGLLLIVSHPLRLVFSGTQTWLSFARWVTG